MLNQALSKLCAALLMAVISLNRQARANELNYQSFVVQHLSPGYIQQFYHKGSYSIVSEVRGIGIQLPYKSFSIKTLNITFNPTSRIFETNRLDLEEKTSEPQLLATETQNKSRIMGCAYFSDDCFLVKRYETLKKIEEEIYYFDLSQPQQFQKVFSTTIFNSPKKIAHIAAIDGSKYSIAGLTTNPTTSQDSEPNNEDEGYFLIRTASPDSPDFSHQKYFGFALTDLKNQSVTNHDVIYIKKSKYVASVFNESTYIHDFTRRSNNSPYRFYQNSVKDSSISDPKIGFLDLSQKVVWVDWYLTSPDKTIARIYVEILDIWDNLTVQSDLDLRTSTGPNYDWRNINSVSTIPGSDFYAIPGYKELIIAKYSAGIPMSVVYKGGFNINLNQVSYMISAGLFIIGQKVGLNHG